MQPLISWILSLIVGGLPIFMSDRADVYLQNTNNVPWTVAYDIGGTQTFTFGTYDGNYGDVNSAGPVWVFQGPNCYLYIASASDAGYPVAVFWWLGTGGGGMSVDAVNDSGQYAFGFSPFGMSDPDQTHLLQVEWVEPSLKRQLQHVEAGVLLGMGFDLTIFVVYLPVKLIINRLILAI